MSKKKAPKQLPGQNVIVTDRTIVISLSDDQISQIKRCVNEGGAKLTIKELQVTNLPATITHAFETDD